MAIPVAAELKLADIDSRSGFFKAGLMSDSSLSPVIASLRKHTYSNILKILQPKKGKFSDKKI